MWNKENTYLFVLLKRKFKATLLPNIYTATKKCWNQTRNTELVLHRIQQYLGLKQYTIPVNNSTPESKCCDPSVRWYPQGSTRAHRFFLCTRLARLDSRDIYRHLRKLLVFKSVRKRFHVVSKPDHPPLKNTEFSCFLTDTFSRNQMSQIHKLNGVGARNRQIKTMLLRFLSCRKGPQKHSRI